MFILKQNILRIRAWILLTLFVGYFAGITFFPHKHIINNQIVVHSHPFTGGSESHSHTSNVIHLLVLLSGFATRLLAAGISLVAFFRLCRIVNRVYVNTYTRSICLYVNFLRPPPAIS